MMLTIHHKMLFVMHERLTLGIESKVRRSLHYCLLYADLPYSVSVKFVQKQSQDITPKDKSKKFFS